MSIFKDEIKKQQEYYTALKEALKPNQQLFSLLKHELPDEYDWERLQELVENHPENTSLPTAMQKDDGLVLFCFLCLPIAQVISFCIMNCLPNLASPPLPPNYTLFDPNSLYEELKKFTLRGREQIFNYYYLIDYKYSEKLKIAITEPNIDSLKEIIESNDVDLSWVQRALGIIKYGNEMNESFLNGDVPEELEDGLFRDYLKSVYSDDIPYLDGYYDSLLKDGDDAMNKATGFILKYYWYIYEQFKPKTREIIDAYINKPCFKDFVSKCRLEFEVDGREREKDESLSTWLPEDFFSDSNLPDTKKKNWLRGLKEAVINGWYSEEGPQNKDEGKGDGRLKLMSLINECSKQGFISDDNVTKAKMAYVLTGRNVGFDVDDEKPLQWNPQYKKCFYYLVKYLFDPSSYVKASKVVDGIGIYPSKVSNRSELDERKQEESRNTFVINSKRISDMADNPEVQDFRLFAHGLYDFCIDHKPNKGEGRFEIDRQPKEKEESSEEA